MQHLYLNSRLICSSTTNNTRTQIFSVCVLYVAHRPVGLLRIKLSIYLSNNIETILNRQSPSPVLKRADLDSKVYSDIMKFETGSSAFLLKS